MCTRYYIDNSSAKLSLLVCEALSSPIASRFYQKICRPIVESGEVRPTDIVPVIAPSRSGKKTVFPMRWGFSNGFNGKPILNARVETASERRSFMESWKSRRCIIPASYYFEWEHFKGPDGKQKTGAKYAIQPTGDDITWLCGLYRMEEDLPVFVVLTRKPGEKLSMIHDRMPLILPEDKIDEWIMPESDPQSLLPFTLTDMYMEKAD